MKKDLLKTLTSLYENVDQKLRPMNTNLSSGPLLNQLNELMNSNERGVGALKRAVDWYYQSSVPTEDPRFMNQLWSGQSQGGILAESLGAVANTSMYTFEVAPAATLIEKHCLELLSNKAGFKVTEGTFVPGASYGNLLGLMLARQSAFPESKQQGQPEKLVVYCSEESHYSISKAAIVMGFGLDQVVKVTVDDRGKMNVGDLAEKVLSDRNNGRRPFAIVATAGTTVRGAIDPIESIAAFCAKENIWLHVDAALGGSLLFSKQQAHHLKGVEKANSMIWNLHKLMGVPIHCSAFLTNVDGALGSTATLSKEETSYIFRDENQLDLGPFSFQCGRKADSLKMWLALVEEGEDGFETRVDSIIEKAKYFEEKISSSQVFRLVCPRESVNVCFQYDFGTNDVQKENALNKKLRDILLAGEELAINYGMVGEELSLRLVPFNPVLSFEHLDNFYEVLLKEGERVKQSL